MSRHYFVSEMAVVFILVAMFLCFAVLAWTQR